MRSMKETKENKTKLILEAVVLCITLLAGITLIMVAGHVDLETWQRVTLTVIALVVIFGGIAVAAVLEMTAGGFECPKCGKYFVPTKTAYIMGMHTVTRRHLRCPHCGVKSWCRRRLAQKEEQE